jgi:hypothetical protein
MKHKKHCKCQDCLVIKADKLKVKDWFLETVEFVSGEPSLAKLRAYERLKTRNYKHCYVEQLLAFTGIEFSIENYKPTASELATEAQELEKDKALQLAQDQELERQWQELRQKAIEKWNNWITKNNDLLNSAIAENKATGGTLYYALVEARANQDISDLERLLKIADRASWRHNCTSYDDLLARGIDRDIARELIQNED